MSILADFRQFKSKKITILISFIKLSHHKVVYFLAGAALGVSNWFTQCDAKDGEEDNNPRSLLLEQHFAYIIIALAPFELSS